MSGCVPKKCFEKHFNCLVALLKFENALKKNFLILSHIFSTLKQIYTKQKFLHSKLKI